ncbi:MAG: thiol disulfide exchange role in cytochrome c biogenesis [Chloroflexi bacterium]|nr:thiol disulfide exchange role in cytochrome c biogenesis [Chloroflexota bacterium]
MYRILSAVGAVLLLGAAVLLVWRVGLPQNNRILGEIVPFSADTLDGQSVIVDTSLDKPIVLNFWATWCKPCVVEMPRLEDAYQDVDEEWLLIGVNAGEDPTKVQEWIQEHPVSFPIIIDSTGEIAVSYGAQSQLPTTVFIDRQGYIRKIVYGLISENALEDGLDAIGIEK